jgi:hypothetical protein
VGQLERSLEERDPLAEGDFYPGDLLVAMARIPGEFWRRHPEWFGQLRKVTGSVDLRPLSKADQRDIAAFGAVDIDGGA